MKRLKYYCRYCGKAYATKFMTALCFNEDIIIAQNKANKYSKKLGKLNKKI